jgi:hypothetical protein
MAAKLVDCVAILVAFRRIPGMSVANSRSLRSDIYVCMQHFARRYIHVAFRRFGGMYCENSCNVFLVLFMALWVPIFATLCKRVALRRWHAFLFLGLRPMDFFPPCSFFAWWFPLPFSFNKQKRDATRGYGSNHQYLSICADASRVITAYCS